MAHFVKLDSNNVVTRVIVIKDSKLIVNAVSSESHGVAHCRVVDNDANGTWKRTSYSGSIRGKFAGVGFTYNPTLDIFIEPKPFPSWVLNSGGTGWESPLGDAPDVTVTTDPPSFYEWDEDAYQADNTAGWNLITPAAADSSTGLPPL